MSNDATLAPARRAKRKIATAYAQSQAAASVLPIDGYSGNQIRAVMEAIATQACLLRDLLSRVRIAVEEGQGKSWVRTASDTQIAEHLAMLIGAQADQLLGNGWLGPVASWTTGDDIRPEEESCS